MSSTAEHVRDVQDLGLAAAVAARAGDLDAELAMVVDPAVDDLGPLLIAQMAEAVAVAEAYGDAALRRACLARARRRAGLS